MIGLAGIQDSATSIPWWIVLDLEVSEPVDQPSLAAGTILLDSAARPVEVTQRWLTPVNLRLVPRRELMSNAWYTLRVRLDSLVDFQGNRGRSDSVMAVRFKTRDLKTTGVIDGIVSRHKPFADSGKIHLTARGLGGTSKESRTMVLDAPGPFRMERVVEGTYVMEVYRDADRSGVFTAGRPYPFVPSEPFAVGMDTVKVRARWSVEGVRLKFP